MPSDFPAPATAQLIVEGWTLCEDDVDNMADEDWTFCDRPVAQSGTSPIQVAHAASVVEEKPSYAEISARLPSVAPCAITSPSLAAAPPLPAHRETVVNSDRETVVAGCAAAAVRSMSPTNAWSWARLAQAPTPLAPLVLTVEKMEAEYGAEARSRSGSTHTGGSRATMLAHGQEGESDEETEYMQYKQRGAKRRGRSGSSGGC